MSRQAPIVFIMAAGLGTRMKSDTAKVLHKIAGRPVLHWIVMAARAAITIQCRTGRPAILWRTFAVSLFIRVPSPAAMMNTIGA